MYLAMLRTLLQVIWKVLAMVRRISNLKLDWELGFLVSLTEFQLVFLLEISKDFHFLQHE